MPRSFNQAAVDEAVLDQAVRAVFRPAIDDGAFEPGGREAYLHDTVLPDAQRALAGEALADDPKTAVRSALQAHGNLLHSTEIAKATDFLDVADADTVRERVTDLLHGDASIAERAARFLDWGGLQDGEGESAGNTVGFNGTVVSYLLAADAPATQAFCKPSIYKASVRALLGDDHVVGPSDEARRIAHASRFYSDLLRRLRRDYDLPVDDLLHVHSLLYLLSDTSSEETTWDTLISSKDDSKAFWLNCDPDRWDPRDYAIGDRQTYTARTERGGTKRQLYDHFQEVEPGDVLVGYLTTPVRQIVAEFRVTKSLYEDEKGRERIEFEKVEAYDDGPTYDQLQTRLSSDAPLGSQGSLFRLTESQLEAIRSLAGDGSSADDGTPTAPEPPPPYGIDDATADLFHGREAFAGWLRALRAKQNVILQGPPGTGKTFAARRLAYTLIGAKDRSRTQMVQFHQSYAYEDFIRGYRPNPSGGFALEDGVFYRFCRRAAERPGPHVFLIDEINRGNLSKIFGELMMLIEPDKRGPRHALPLTYQREGESDFFVPENVYLLGMMNTADRSLALVDYALRRRFRFIDVEPQFTSTAFQASLREGGAPAALVQTIVDRLTALNAAIADDTNLGPGYRIGHSYFCPPDDRPADADWYLDTVTQEIAPLLREYWFDAPETANDHVDALTAAP
jgi:hypothetical protein